MAGSKARLPLRRGLTESSEVSIYRGGCHCENLRLELESARAPADFEIRACQCSFCRKHATLAIADPAGRLELSVRRLDDLGRYSFGQNTIDFLLCRNCGVYVGAVTKDGSEKALVIVNALDDREDFAGNDPLEIDYDDESRPDRVERRRTGWTPFRVTAST